MFRLLLKAISASQLFKETKDIETVRKLIFEDN